MVLICVVSTGWGDFINLLMAIVDVLRLWHLENCVLERRIPLSLDWAEDYVFALSHGNLADWTVPNFCNRGVDYLSDRRVGHDSDRGYGHPIWRRH